MQVWDAATGNKIVELLGPLGTFDTNAMTFRADAKRVITSLRNNAEIWDIESRQKITILIGHTDLLNAAAFSGNSKRVATASDDKTARIWDAESGNQIAVLKGHTDWCRLLPCQRMASGR